MPDFDVAFDYELLNTLAKDTDRLHDQLGDGRLLGRGFYDSAALGAGFKAVNHFFFQWGGPFANAQDLLKSLSETYRFVAQRMFEQDAGYAASAAVQAQGFMHSNWKMKKDSYDAWKDLTGQSITVHAWDDKGHEYLKEQKLADPNAPDAPPPPGYEPTLYDYIHDDGEGTDNVHHSAQVTYDSDGKVTSTDSTVDDGDGGLKYHEHTDYGANGSYTTTITHTDGSKTVIEVHGNENGTGTRNITNTDKDGKTTDTSSWSGTGLGGDHPDPKWTNNDPDATDTDGDGKDDKDDGGTKNSNTGVGSTF
ncbi:hypothetical protein SAMN06272735_8787 [Streptomyces sp. TLI_55]|uniref:hypothetical protein n=1 Tax=Streptomyces sp. TLI_55 TaxID=1938861 RepID=UPI000BC42310|nr:hypothetical protein [Streptomyces sp. TLI_55]SNX88346.1 hypothetical protein SAMN06272735_8787 [Streptomyces sp. TLI_55]